MANYNVSYKIDASGNLTQVNQTAISINKNMKEAATAASGLGKAASGALAATRARPAMEEREYERARGVTGMTGASGRDFAKQAEGLGGLVRLYATFAANIFAVTQAFEILKRSFQFEQLERASEAFAVTTGKNLSGIAKELRVLSDGALTAKAAQQFANYGQSAGFTADQLRRLVGVARGASQALGRDFSDAIDRLIRGTGKLEPELLDEIGILTRTKSAGEEYAKTIGKTFEQLTQFEKVQAFTNAVIAEGERKFGAVAKAVPVSAFERFSAAAIDAGTALANFVNKGVVPLLDLLSNNPGLIIAGIIAAIAKLANTALPLLTNLSAKAKAAAKEQESALLGKQEDAARAAKAASDTRIAAINAEKTAFLAAEEAKVKALNKTAQERMQSRGQVPGAKGTALQTQLMTVQVGEFDKLTKLQDKVTSQIKTQIHAIETLNTKNKTATAEALVRNKNEIATRTETLALLYKQQSALQGIIAKQGEYNRILAQEGVITKSNAIAFNTAELAKFKAQQKDLMASVVNIAGQNVKGKPFAAFTEAFKVLGTQSVILGKQVTDAGGSFDSLSKRFPMLTGMLQKFTAGSLLASGALRILGVAAVGLINGLMPIIGIATTLYFAFDMLIDAFGGYSDKIDAAKESNETLRKSNELAATQVTQYTQLIEQSKGSLQEWATIADYSASAIGAIGDNLSKASKDLVEFEMSTGAVSKAWQSVLATFGMDLGTKFAQNFKNSITNALSLAAGSDKAKIEQAILKMFPDAKTIEEAVTQFEGLNTVSKAFRGAQVASEINKVNQELKSSADNLKNATTSWEKLGEALDEYNKKNEVKDPKLKDTVTALRSIEAAYAAAGTEADKVKIMSGITKETLEKIVKLGKERNIDTSDFVSKVTEAKTKNQELLEIQKKQAEAQKQLAIDAANALFNTVNGYDFGAFDVVKDARSAYDEFLTDMKNRPPVDVEDAAERKARLLKLSETTIAALEESAKKANSLQRQGIMYMIETIRSEYPRLAEELTTAIGGGILNGLRKFTPQAVQLFSDLRAIENASDPSRGKSASKEQIEAAAKANNKSLADAFAATNKLEEGSAKVARVFDLQVKRAQQMLEVLKQQAAVQQQAVGYISAALSEEMRVAQHKVISMQLEKEMQEIKKNEAKRNNDKKAFNEAQAKYEELSKEVAQETARIAKEAADTEALRTQIIRERVRYEKEVLEFKKLEIEINNQIVDSLRSINTIDETTATIARAQLTYQNQLLDIEKKRADIASRQKALDAGKAGDSETQATINAENQLLSLVEKRTKLTRDLAIEQAKYNEYVANAKSDLDSVTNSLSEQLNFTIALATQSTNQQRALEQLDLLAKDIVIQFEALPKSQQNAINMENMLLAAANKVLETKKQIYELNAKEGSGADFADTVRQGIEVANLEYAKTTKSLAKTTVDALVGAIDTTVDALFDKLKSGAKISFKEIIKAGTDFVKNAMLDFVSQNIKTFLRDSLAGLFNGQSAEQQQKQAIEDLKKSIEENSKTHDLMRKPTQDLISALGSLESTIANWNPQSGSTSGNSADPLDAIFGGGINSLFGPSTQGLSTFTNTLLEGEQTTTFFTEEIGAAAKATIVSGNAALGSAQAFGEATKSVLAFASSLKGGGGGGGIGGLLGSLGSLFGGLPGMNGNSLSTTFASLFSGNASELAADFVGPPTALANSGVAGSASGMFAGMLGGASTGAAVGSLAASLFGNERNQQGMQLGGTIGGIAGSFFGPIGSLIGSALGSALGSLWKSGGGPKSGGFAQSGEGFQRFYTPSDKDSELTESVKNISSAYDSVIRQLGGSGKANFALGFDTDPKGTANSRVTAGVMVNGKEIQTTTEAGRSAEELTKELEAASSRLLLTAIRESDLPENVAAYYAGLTDDVIKTLSKEEVEKKLDFGSVLGTISKSRDKIAEIFGEDLYNLTEDSLSKFQLGTEKLSETFARLTQEFSITSRVIKFFGADTQKVFGAVGLASAEMRTAMIEGAGGIEAFTEQFNYFYENFYSDLERAGFEFASAGETIRNGFRSLNMSVPSTMEGFRQAVTAALQAGNVELYNSLMELAPAFDSVRGAIEDVMSTISDMSESFLDRIAADTQTAEQRYATFQERANGAQAEIDRIMEMTPEALIEAVQAGTISPDKIEELSTRALQNAEAAWNILTEDQKKLLGGQFTTFVQNLNSNTANVLEAINAALLATTKPTDLTKPLEVTTSTDVVPPSTEELLAVPTLTSDAIVDGFTRGSQAFSDKVLETFSALSLEGVNPLGTQPLSPDLIESQRLREEQQAQAQLIREEQERVNQENQAAAFAAMADKLLGAANGMLSAAASMQAAASTPQTINVTVETLSDDTSAEVGVK